MAMGAVTVSSEMSGLSHLTAGIVAWQGTEYGHAGGADPRGNEESPRDKWEGILPTVSQNVPCCPILPPDSRYFVAEVSPAGQKIFVSGSILSHSVPLLLFVPFGQPMSLLLSDGTRPDAAWPAPESKTKYRTHDHIISGGQEAWRAASVIELFKHACSFDGAVLLLAPHSRQHAIIESASGRGPAR